MAERIRQTLSPVEFEELADFRYQIRRFLHFSESAALAEGLEPRQHQALLAIKAMPAGQNCTVGQLAERLFLQHQSTVGLVDRLQRQQLVRRTHSKTDARQVIITLTQHGEDILQRLSLAHRAELHGSAPEFSRALRAIVRRAQTVKRQPKKKK